MKRTSLSGVRELRPGRVQITIACARPANGSGHPHLCGVVRAPDTPRRSTRAAFRDGGVVRAKHW